MEFLTKNLGIKIGVVLIALFFWTQQRLLSPWTEEISIPLHIENIPEGLIILEQPATEIPFIVEGSGMNLLKLKLAETYVRIDASEFKYWNNLLKISRNDLVIPENIHIDKIQLNLKRNLMLKLDRMGTVFRPVAAAYASKRDKNYFANRKLTFEPTRVRVEGPQSLLDTLASVKTIPISADQMQKGEKTLSLQPLATPLMAKANKVRLKLNETVTKQRTISMIPINYPRDMNMYIIPQKVTILVTGEEEQVQNLTKQSIRATVKPENMKTGKSAKIEFETPAGIKITEYSPEKVRVEAYE
ncbi:MAG: hypothetical protein K8S56_01555 [Candidatus Cloacimonetes bacterium]|nr:hypothetical protein [Candidatus Cloacimonadota bacterium]